MGKARSAHGAPRRRGFNKGAHSVSHDRPTESNQKWFVNPQNQKFQDEEVYVEEVIKTVRKECLIRTYKVDGWDTAKEFLEKLAFRSGKLLKKGEPNVSQVARMVLNDWQRGKLPFYATPEGFEVSLSKRNEDVSTTTEVDKEQEKQDDAVQETVSDADKDKQDNPDKPIYINKLIVAQDFTTNENNTENNDSKSVNEETVEDSDSSDISDYYSKKENNRSRVEDHLTNDAATVTQLKRKKLEAASRELTVEDIPQNRKDSKVGAEKKLTGKQRRAIERAEKRTKSGSNFYEVSNVKNRNRNKKKPL